MFGPDKININGNCIVAGACNTPVASTTAAQTFQTHAITPASTSASFGTVPPQTSVGASGSFASAGFTNGPNGFNQTPNTHRVPDVTKRKKSKTRNSTVANTSTHSKDHLDAWLETCLKDASPTQLSSSSEFLDYNPANNFQSNRKVRSHQQQPLQQSFSNSTQKPSSSFSQQLPYPTPFGQGLQKNVPTFLKNSLSNRFPFGINPLLSHTDGSVEFASLPPNVNHLLGSENEHNSIDVLDGSNNPNMSRVFRFSDPCLLNPSDTDSKVSGQNTPDRRNHTNPGEMDNNKIFQTLMEQISLLHEANSKIYRNLHETKVDVEALKHAPNWGLRHRRDSLSGLSTHSQPLGFGFGTQSPAPTFHSGTYTPGMMTDFVREVKEAARVREDALISRVKTMVEERTWSINENNLRMRNDIDELKSQVQQLRCDRKDYNKRILHLETENKYMRYTIATLLNNRNRENEILHNKHHRNNYQPTQMRQPKRSNSLNLHYGVIQQTTEEEEPTNSLPIAEHGLKTSTPIESSDQRNSFSSSDGQTSIVHLGKKNGWTEENKTSKKTQKLNTNDENKDIRKELQEAKAARNEADNRIIALENMVKTLQVKHPNNGDERILIAGGGSNNMMKGGTKNTGGGGVSSAAPAYSLPVSSSSSSSSPTLKAKCDKMPRTPPITALVSSPSTASHPFKLKSSNQIQTAAQQKQHEKMLSKQSHQHQHQQQQQVTQGLLPTKMSLSGPITDL